MPDSATDLLLTKYALTPASESVVRLGTLVADRTAESSQIAKIIAEDPALTFRLLEGEVPATGVISEIEGQIFRLGIEPVLVIAMSDPLLTAVKHTFETMAGLPLTIVDPEVIPPADVVGYVSRLSFTGRANGSVFLRMEPRFCETVAALVLGMDRAAVAHADVRDVFAELSNMIVGNFKSNLSDAGLPCRLSVPEVYTDGVFAPPRVARGRHRTFGFYHENNPLLVDIFVEFAD